MNRYALINGNVVANIVEQDDTPTIEGQWVNVTNEFVGPGFTYDGSTFAAPVDTSPRIITKLAFRNRFSDAEKQRLYTAAKTNVAIQIYLDDLQAASFINLRLEKNRNGVLMLEAAGLLDAPGRAETILDAPLQADEIPS